MAVTGKTPAALENPQVEATPDRAFLATWDAEPRTLFREFSLERHCPEVVMPPGVAVRLAVSVAAWGLRCYWRNAWERWGARLGLLDIEALAVREEAEGGGRLVYPWGVLIRAEDRRAKLVTADIGDGWGITGRAEVVGRLTVTAVRGKAGGWAAHESFFVAARALRFGSMMPGHAASAGLQRAFRAGRKRHG